MTPKPWYFDANWNAIFKEGEDGPMILRMCPILGDEGALNRNAERIVACDEENKRLKGAGDKMQSLIIHMACTEWEETHDPETEKYTIPEFYNDILKEWEKAKGANQKEANRCDSNLERKRKDEKRI